MHKVCHKPETEHVAHKCSDCGKLFRYRCSLKRHQMHKICHKPETEHVVHKCSDCGKLFNHRCSLKRHQIHKICQKPETVIPKKYICREPGCEANFKNLFGLTQHTDSIHKHKTYECPKCESTFTRKFSLKQHYRRKHETENNDENQSDSLQTIIKLSIKIKRKLINTVEYIRKRYCFEETVSDTGRVKRREPDDFYPEAAQSSEKIKQTEIVTDPETSDQIEEESSPNKIETADFNEVQQLSPAAPDPSKISNFKSTSTFNSSFSRITRNSKPQIKSQTKSQTKSQIKPPTQTIELNLLSDQGGEALIYSNPFDKLIYRLEKLTDLKVKHQDLVTQNRLEKAFLNSENSDQTTVKKQNTTKNTLTNSKLVLPQNTNKVLTHPSTRFKYQSTTMPWGIDLDTILPNFADWLGEHESLVQSDINDIIESKIIAILAMCFSCSIVGINELLEKQFCHADIKPANLLLYPVTNEITGKQSATCKIADFGLLTDLKKNSFIVSNLKKEHEEVKSQGTSINNSKTRKSPENRKLGKSTKSLVKKTQIIEWGTSDFQPSGVQKSSQFDKKSVALSMVHSAAWCFRINDDDLKSAADDLELVFKKNFDRLDVSTRKVWKIILDTVRFETDVPKNVPVIDLVETSCVEKMINKNMILQKKKELVSFRVKEI